MKKTVITWQMILIGFFVPGEYSSKLAKLHLQTKSLANITSQEVYAQAQTTYPLGIHCTRLIVQGSKTGIFSSR